MAVYRIHIFMWKIIKISRIIKFAVVCGTVYKLKKKEAQEKKDRCSRRDIDTDKVDVVSVRKKNIEER